MNLKRSLFIAFVISIIALVSWESYWRTQGYYPTLNDEKALWAIHRSDVETATKEDLVILGASRIYFDIQLKEFNEVTGKNAIQLASTGSSPLPTFHDIVNNSDFNGTVIIGITPGIFFSTTKPEAFPWRRPQAKVDYYEDRTYAQRINYWISARLQQNLVLMSADEEEWSDDIDLKSLLRRIEIGNRTGDDPKPPFNFFGDVNLHRNMSMTTKTSSDTAFANTIIRVWKFFSKGSHPPDKEGTTAFFIKDLKKFKSRNGKVILVRCPSSGSVRERELESFPRKDFWDDLVKQADVNSYHFEDYDGLKNLECPEESHLSAQDARYFTTELLNLMKADGALTISKTN
jgi:hypothetical protein